MKHFAVEIIECENGYIILEGNSLVENQPYAIYRRKWVSSTIDELRKIIGEIALEFVKNKQVAREKVR